MALTVLLYVQFRLLHCEEHEQLHREISRSRRQMANAGVAQNATHRVLQMTLVTQSTRSRATPRLCTYILGEEKCFVARKTPDLSAAPCACTISVVRANASSQPEAQQSILDWQARISDSLVVSVLKRAEQFIATRGGHKCRRHQNLSKIPENKKKPSTSRSTFYVAHVNVAVYYSLFLIFKL